MVDGAYMCDYLFIQFRAVAVGSIFLASPPCG
jgi:hypothetical protein